jgi:membrane-associated HD superfamily phosphohydrolase
MSKIEMQSKGKIHDQLIGWKYSGWTRILLFLLLMLLFYFSLSPKLIPQVYDIQLGAASAKTIYAPSQTENFVATEKAKEDAAKKVQPVYRIVNLRNDLLVDSIFDRLLQINSDAEVKFDDKVSIYRNVIPQLVLDMENKSIKSLRDSGQYNDTLLQEMQNRLVEQQYRLPEEVYFKIPRLTKEDIAAMLPVTKSIVSKIMTEPIPEAQESRSKVAELVNTSELTNNTTREMVQELVRTVITPNKFFDQKGTEDAKGQARENVKPVYINKNDVLVNQGEIITDEIYQRLNKLELLKDKANYLPELGLIILAL